MCLGPKEAMFEKSKELSQHLKPLYIRGHIDGRPISKMLVDGGCAVNLMSYSIFKKLGREGNQLVKINLKLNGMGATRWRLEASTPWSSRPTGSMGVHSACRGGIFLATIFLASQRMGLYPCVCSQLLNLSPVI
jgi:hypothetical protein